MRAVLIATMLQLGAVQPPVITGTVTDPQGRTVPDATVRIEAAGAAAVEARTGSDGLFTTVLVAGAAPVRLIVTKPGFAQQVETLAVAVSQEVTIVLQPAPFFEAVQVTSTRSDVARADPTVTAAVFPASELVTSAPLTIDDALKMVPGFTLFPSSRVANPTAQTMMLRGLGGSGISRSLVLADGIPLNDAFGGWVYWAKVPQAAIDRIEVVRGGGSDLYGADAVGGVVQVLTLEPAGPMGRALLEAGNLQTGRISLFGGGRAGRWSFGGAGQWFTTEGYILVAPPQRGEVERPAGSAHRSALAFASYATESWRFGGRASAFSEDRKNGTVLQVNDTDARQASAEAAGALGSGFVSVHVFGGTQGYDQTFSTFSPEPPRAEEYLDRTQRVPTRIAGGSVQWMREWGLSSLLAGAEARVAEGRSIETSFVPAPADARSEAGGSERHAAAYARVALAVTDRLTVVTGAHADVWRSASDQSAFGQTVGAFNPRLSLAYRLGDTGLALRGSVFGGFRAPTLNELHRRFQIGNDVTLPNEALTPERLRAAEAGLVASRGRISTRITGFWNVLTDTITAVTLATSPSINIRQRQNADRMRSAGVEIEADLRLPRALSIAVTGAFLDSRFRGRSGLRNYRVPHVAHYSLGVGGRFDGRRWTASTHVRITGPQFDDDVNTRRLRRATVVDAFAGRTFARRTMIFAAVENVFDAEYDIGRIPMQTLGLPRALRAGVQIALP